MVQEIWWITEDLDGFAGSGPEITLCLQSKTDIYILHQAKLHRDSLHLMGIWSTEISTGDRKGFYIIVGDHQLGLAIWSDGEVYAYPHLHHWFIQCIKYYRSEKKSMDEVSCFAIVGTSSVGSG